jgi:hypothetical protein
MIKDRGDTVNLKATIKDYTGTLYDPDTSVKITITPPSGTAVVTAQSMTPGTTGIYTYAWLSLAASELGNYTVSYTAIDSTYGTEIQYDSFTLAVVSTTGDVIDDLVDRVGVVLEDPSFAIFDSVTAVPQEIQNAVRTASKYVPYESKETVTLTADSFDVDVSAISNLKKVLYAEYEISKDPRQFRNVNRFGDTLTIDACRKPVIGDTAYLYCHKRHSVDDSGSTLTPELEDIVVELAAGNTALNWVGKGRTQIVNSINDILKVGTSIDLMTDDITKSINDLNTLRTNVGTMLTTVQTAIDLGNAQNDLAVTDLASVRSTLTTMMTNVQNAINLANAETDKGVTDLTNARTAFNSPEANIANLIATIPARVTQCLADLTSGRALINTVPVGSSPESQYANYASKELSALAAIANEIVVVMRQGSNLAGQLQNAANHQAAMAGSYLQQANATLSEYVADVGHLGQNISRAVSVANGYLGEAHTTLSKWATDLNNLGSLASHSLSVANGHATQARGYIQELSSRLSVSNIILRYSTWGQQKVMKAESDLRKLAKPQTLVTYPRS